MAVTLAVGLALALVLEPRAFGTWLGVPLPPLFLFWEPTLEPVAGLAAAALLVSALGAPRLLSPRLGPVPFAAAGLALGLGLRLVLSASRGGVGAWSAPFAGAEGSTEYLPAIPGVEGLGLATWLDRFAEIQPSLPVHPSAHPPGTIALLHVLGIDSAGAMATLTIAIGALAIPLTYLLARRLLDERSARVATLLVVFCPAAMIYGVSSADAMFATLGLLAAVPLAARGPLPRAAGAFALTLASLFSWALLAVGAFAALLAWLRDGFRSALTLSLACAAAVVALHLLLFAGTGYDPIGSLLTTGELYRGGISEERPFWYWVFGSPAAFLIAIGVPLAWYAAKGVAAGQRPALALAAIVVTAAVLGFSKAETERIWLFMAPLACVAAAPCLGDRRLPAVLTLLAAQAFATELLFDTRW